MQSQSLPDGLEFFLVILSLRHPGCGFPRCKPSMLPSFAHCSWRTASIVSWQEPSRAFRRWARRIGRGTSDERAYCLAGYHTIRAVTFFTARLSMLHSLLRPSWSTTVRWQGLSRPFRRWERRIGPRRGTFGRTCLLRAFHAVVTHTSSRECARVVVAGFAFMSPVLDRGSFIACIKRHVNIMRF